jgi:hypothetical protein
MKMKCENCPTKEDLDIFKNYGKNYKHTAVEWDMINHIKSCYEPGYIGKYEFDPENGKISIVFNNSGIYDIVEDNYCMSNIGNGDETKICRYYREGICILTGIDIINMIKPCSCKSKEI